MHLRRVPGGGPDLCIPSLHVRVNKLQTEGQINAELRDLAKRIRDLRSELKSQSSAAQPPADARDQPTKTGNPSTKTGSCGH